MDKPGVSVDKGEGVVLGTRGWAGGAGGGASSRAGRREIFFGSQMRFAIAREHP